MVILLINIENRLVDIEKNCRFWTWTIFATKMQIDVSRIFEKAGLLQRAHTSLFAMTPGIIRKSPNILQSSRDFSMSLWKNENK